MNNTKFIVFGASSFIAKKLIKKLSKKYQTIGFSRKFIPQQKGIEFIKTSYNEKKILKILDTKIKKADRPIFIFANGIAESKSFYYLKPVDIKKIIDVNLNFPLIMTNLLIKKFFFKKSCFIYLNSSRSYYSDKGISIYSGTKSGLVNSVKCLSMEYDDCNLTFKAILLGLFKGGLTKKLSKKKISEILNRSRIKKFIKIETLVQLIINITEGRHKKTSIIKCDNGYL